MGGVVISVINSTGTRFFPITVVKCLKFTECLVKL